MVQDDGIRILTVSGKKRKCFTVLRRVILFTYQNLSTPSKL